MTAERCTVAASPTKCAVVIVQRHDDCLRLGHRGDVQHGSDPADDADVRVQNVSGALGHASKNASFV